MRLWDLHQYEMSRSAGMDPVTYQTNMHCILEDTCYRFEYK
jgi:hypothetical protein